MKYTNRGFSTIVILIIIAVLGIIAYGIFKKTTLAPTTEQTIEIEETQTETPAKTQTYKAPQETRTQTSQVTITEEDLTTLETETNLLQTELDDLQFEELGFE